MQGPEMNQCGGYVASKKSGDQGQLATHMYHSATSRRSRISIDCF